MIVVIGLLAPVCLYHRADLGGQRRPGYV